MHPLIRNPTLDECLTGYIIIMIILHLLCFLSKTKGFEVEERLVYQIIEDAGNKGDNTLTCMHARIIIVYGIVQNVDCKALANLAVCEFPKNFPFIVIEHHQSSPFQIYKYIVQNNV